MSSYVHKTLRTMPGIPLTQHSHCHCHRPNLVSLGALSVAAMKSQRRQMATSGLPLWAPSPCEAQASWEHIAVRMGMKESGDGGVPRALWLPTPCPDFSFGLGSLSLVRIG